MKVLGWVDEDELLPGQFSMADALVKAIDGSHRGFLETEAEVEAARKADWKKPDGSAWKFSWEK